MLIRKKKETNKEHRNMRFTGKEEKKEKWLDDWKETINNFCRFLMTRNIYNIVFDYSVL